MANGIPNVTTRIAAIGAVLLLAMPAIGALVHPYHNGHFAGPLLPVPEAFGWTLVALGFSLFTLLRAQAIQATIPLAPARLARSSQWQLLASSSQIAEGRDITRIPGV